MEVARLRGRNHRTFYILGIVRAAGNGTKDEEMIVKPGDTVLYGKYAGNEIEIDGEKLLMMRQNDILAIVIG